MPKLLLLTHEFPPFRGGIGVYAEQLASAATDAGYDVAVLAPSYHQDQTTRDRANYRFAVRRFGAGFYKPSAMPALLFRTARILSYLDFDILHAIDIPFITALAFIRKYRSFRFIASVHGAASFSVQHSKMVKVLGVSRMYEVADRIVANSTFTKDLLLRTYPTISAGRVIMSHLGVDQLWFQEVPAETIASLRDRYNIPEEKKIILTVARLDPRKGHRSAFEAIELLPQRIKDDVVYVIVGDAHAGAYTKELQARAEGCGAQVVFTGALADEELRAMTSAATLFCMPGVSEFPGAEGFGLAYLEAAAMKVPSIAFRAAAIPEIIRDGETGILVAPGDIPALARGIEVLVTRNDETRRLGVQARAWASTFTWAGCVERTYKGFLPGNPG